MIVPALDLDTMAEIAVDAGRAAREGRAAVTPPVVASRALLRVIAAPGPQPRAAAARLYRAAVRGALDPATE